MTKLQKRKSTKDTKKKADPWIQNLSVDATQKFSFPLNNLPVIYLIIILACIGVYYRTLSYGFSYNDDDVIVLNNMSFLKNISNIPKAIVSDAWFMHKQIELYRPLQNVSFIIDAQMGENIIFYTHLTNLILHTLCCMAVFYLLTLFRFNRKYALFGALIYAVHFLFLHAVIWIPARGDLFLSLFSFLYVITFLLIIRTDKWYYYALNIVAFALALFSKETAIMLPFIFLAYLFLLSRKLIFTKGNGILAVFYLIVFIIFFYLRDISIAKNEQQIGLESLLLNLRIIPETIVKLFVPVNFSTMPSFNIVATLLGSIIIIGFIIFFIIKKHFFNKFILFSLLWFAFFLLPGMAYRPNFASHTYEYIDHRAYLPALGILMIILSLLQGYENRSKSTTVSNINITCLLLVLFYLGFMNFRLNTIYKNAVSYSESAIKNNPRCSLGYFIHGNEMNKISNKDSALNDFNNALKYYPEFFDARFNKALILFEMKKYEESIVDLDYIATFKPDYSFKVYHLRGVARFMLKNYEGAEKDFQTTLQMNPDYTEAKKNLDILKTTLKNNEGNHKFTNEADQLNTEAVNLAKNGNYKEAIILFEKSFTKDSTAYVAQFNIGNCMHAMGNTKGACEKWSFAAKHGNRGAQEMLNKYCN